MFFSMPPDLVPSVIRLLYSLLVVFVGWVFFRSETFTYAVGYLRAMVTPSTPYFYNSQLFLYLNNEFYVALILALVGAAPVFPMIDRRLQQLSGQWTGTVFPRSTWPCRRPATTGTHYGSVIWRSGGSGIRKRPFFPDLARNRDFGGFALPGIERCGTIEIFLFPLYEKRQKRRCRVY